MDITADSTTLSTTRRSLRKSRADLKVGADHTHTLVVDRVTGVPAVREQGQDNTWTSLDESEKTGESTQ